MRASLVIPAALALACAAAPAAAQDAPAPPPTPELSASAVATRGARADDFVPRGWKIAARADGDLNGDGRADAVLHLVPRETWYSPDSITAAPGTHALVVLLADGAGYRRAGVAPRLLQPDVPQYGLTLRIRNGVVITDQNYGMTEVTDVTHRFRLEPATGRFLLIGRDQLLYTRPQEARDSEKTSENYLTGVRLITTGHFTRSGGYRESTRREQIPRSKAYLDDIDDIS